MKRKLLSAVVLSSMGTFAFGADYSSGTKYNRGNVVERGGESYECVQPNWCSSDAAWAYAPGTGTAWSQAWKMVPSSVTPKVEDKAAAEQEAEAARQAEIKRLAEENARAEQEARRAAEDARVKSDYLKDRASSVEKYLPIGVSSGTATIADVRRAEFTKQAEIKKTSRREGCTRKSRARS